MSKKHLVVIRPSISGFSPDGVGNSPGKSWDAPHYIDIAKATRG